jgi:hypothetical protein
MRKGSAVIAVLPLKSPRRENHIDSISILYSVVKERAVYRLAKDTLLSNT